MTKQKLFQSTPTPRHPACVREDSPAPYSPKVTASTRALVAEAMQALDNDLRVDGFLINAPAEAGNYIKLRIAGCERETMLVLFLDTRHKVIAHEELSYGTVDGAEVHPREILKRALVHNAAAVILGHNHPSQNPTPSAADRAVTAQIKQALAMIEVRLLDHFVVGEGAPVSLAARGWV